ncbi:DUF924 family protein [Bauldia sp.]|uniref:DUF924 family protein n=1 Tax=Bauldia sp. TaxID=2575872 RepID=UPI003BAD8640
MPSDQQEALAPVLRDIHAYWFGPLSSPTARNPEKSEIWFKQSDETDAHIRDTYGRYIDEAAAIDWDLDALSREEQVGLIILLDQFPRNIHRDSGQAFAYDAKVLAITDALIAAGLYRFYLVEQAFVGIPLQHSEDIADQDRALLVYAQQAISAPDDWKDLKRTWLDFACKHREIIRKFGRYPHRNEVLGRPSTEEEVAFMKEHGRGY